jgi:hypothetical protein
MSEILARAASLVAFKPALPADQLSELHIPFSELGFDSHPEDLVASAVAQESGLTLVVGAPGNGKSSLLAYVADALANGPAGATRRYLPLFVPVSSRGEDATSLETFGAIAIASLLAVFDDLTHDQRQAFLEATSEEITRQSPSHALNAKLAAKPFGVGVEGGVEARDEVITVTTAGGPADSFGGLATLAHTLRGRDRELILIVEDTDGWTLQDDAKGNTLARLFFGGVLAPLATAEVSLVVALQTRWTTEVEEFEGINERALRRVTLPTFESGDHAEFTVRRVIARRLEWQLGAPHDARDAVTDAAVETLATTLRETGSIRTVLTMLRDTLDQLDGNYPERIDREHLVETA